MFDSNQCSQDKKEEERVQNSSEAIFVAMEGTCCRPIVLLARCCSQRFTTTRLMRLNWQPATVFKCAAPATITPNSSLQNSFVMLVLDVHGIQSRSRKHSEIFSMIALVCVLTLLLLLLHAIICCIRGSRVHHCEKDAVDHVKNCRLNWNRMLPPAIVGITHIVR